jgi:WD repeat-containing protein 23
MENLSEKELSNSGEEMMEDESWESYNEIEEEIETADHKKWLKHNNNTGEGTPCQFHLSPQLNSEQSSISQNLKKTRLHSKLKDLVSNDKTHALVSNDNSKVQLYNCFLPNTITYTYEGLNSRIYNCKFNDAGDTFVVTTQGATAVFDFKDFENLALKKVILCDGVQWTITDTDITSDGKYMVHSTMSANVHLFDVENRTYCNSFNVKGKPGTTTPTVEEDDNDYNYYSWYRVFSIKFSGDGKSLIAATGRSSSYAQLQVFDMTTNKITVSIDAHDNDINSACYVDKQDSNLVLTASDDGLCKLWDIRSSDSKPAGVFQGHFCGLTFVESRNDGKYFLTNSKDQSIKMWDLRKAHEKAKSHEKAFFRFDYRNQLLRPEDIEIFKVKHEKNQNDNSVMTFWGHQTYVTLIRSHFSPKYSTDQRYIYTGSANGRCYIYDTLTNAHVATLQLNQPEHKVVRDLTWHPFTQQLITTDFEGDINKWEFKDLQLK